MTHKTTMQTEKRVLMENTAFILYEKFCSDSGEQRREQFKKAFERYLTDALAHTLAGRSIEGRAIKMLCRDTCAGNKGRRP